MDAPEPAPAPETFRDPWAPRQQVRSVLQFYYPRIVEDVHGGYAAQLDEREGHVYDSETRHLVATCRATYNFSVGATLEAPGWCRSAAAHGLDFLLSAHRDRERGGFDWLLEGRETVDDTRYGYGHAFALLALAAAAEAGLDRAEAALSATADVIDRHFWEDERGLCRTEISADWSEVSAYRGQNSNMHTCEAMLAAHEATGEARYLDRAERVAETLVRDVAGRNDGLVWEHYTPDWERDEDYNRDQPEHQFRPWGLQPGHQVEWTKLLLLLHEHRPADWLVARARALFDWAVSTGWDDEHGGFFYTVDLEGEPVVADKYGWTIAEGIGAAALLGTEVDESYLGWYDRLWDYARSNLVNPKYGNWYERVARDGEYRESRGTAVEPGYHPLNNALLAARALEAESGSEPESESA
jgi:mannose/cellobiose epimerase-like protein (N-acyl-D-glucosamine 2-epimerase family)